MSTTVTRYRAPGQDTGRLLDVARMLANVDALNRRKKQIYSLWIMGYLRFLDRQELGSPRPEHVRRFVDSLDAREDVDATMRRQATEAVVFFHECVLHQSVSEGHGRLGMLSDDEKRSILNQLHGPEKLLARLVFATELDLGEALRLRVGDVDLTRGQIVVTDARGRSKRLVHLDEALADDLEAHLARVQRIHERDLSEGHGAVDLPPGVQDQFPGAESAWVWQWVFPSSRRSVDLRSGGERRYPLEPTTLLDALNRRTAPETRMLTPVSTPEDTLDAILPASMRPASTRAASGADRTPTAPASHAPSARPSASAEPSSLTDRAASADGDEGDHWSTWKPVYA